MKRIHILLSLLLAVFFYSCGSDSDKTDSDQVVAVYKGGSFLYTTPGYSTSSEKFTYFTRGQLIEMFSPAVTTETRNETVNSGTQALKTDAVLQMKATSAELRIVGEKITYSTNYNSKYEVLTLTIGEYTYQGVRLKVENDGIYVYSYNAGDGTEGYILLQPLNNCRYETLLSKEVLSTSENKQPINFTAETTFANAVTALIFTNGTETYKCSFEDNGKAKLEMIEPEQHTLGYLSKQ